MHVVRGVRRINYTLPSKSIPDIPKDYLEVYISRVELVLCTVRQCGAELPMPLLIDTKTGPQSQPRVGTSHKVHFQLANGCYDQALWAAHESTIYLTKTHMLLYVQLFFGGTWGAPRTVPRQLRAS